MASAFVAGVAALVWSHFQMMSAEQVRRRLQETAVDLGATGRDPYFGYGRIDLFSALSQPLFQICVLQLGVKQPNYNLFHGPLFMLIRGFRPRSVKTGLNIMPIYSKGRL